MQWILLLGGGYLLGRMATGETPEQAIRNTFAIVRPNGQKVILPHEEETDSSNDIAVIGS